MSSKKITEMVLEYNNSSVEVSAREVAEAKRCKEYIAFRERQQLMEDSEVSAYIAACRRIDEQKAHTPPSEWATLVKPPMPDRLRR